MSTSSNSPKRRAYVQSFGCRASQADGAAIEESLRRAGFETVGEAGAADLVVVNTCTVTHSADVDARRVIRGIRRKSPSAEIAVTGCYAQRAPEELAGIEGVRWVVGNADKASLAELVGRTHEEFHGQIVRSEFDRQAKFQAMPAGGSRDDRTRPNLKIQDGCGNRCSFCIIPSVRGPSRSATANDVVAQVRELSARYREIVLTGINLGRWGRDLPGSSRFPSLLRRILDETDVGRLRISSVEPMDWSEELIQLMAETERVAKHVHMPLQSGSDSVLKHMRRRYRTRHYADRLMAARNAMPDAAFGADVMTGFPGETEEEFGETVGFIESHPFTYLHVFTYSERAGTEAAEALGVVPMAVRRHRTEVLRKISEAKTRIFEERMAGRVLPSVTLEESPMAMTTNYLRVKMNAYRPPNQLVELAVSQRWGGGLAETAAFSILQ